MHRARAAAHHCLYYLYHFQTSGSKRLDAALAEDRDWAFRRVRSLISSVHVPGEFARGAQELAASETALAHRTALPRSRNPLRQLVGLFWERPAAGDPAQADGIRFWATWIWRPVEVQAGSVEAADVDELVSRLRAFLDLSRPVDTQRWSRWVGALYLTASKLRSALVRNAALALGLAVVALGYAKLEVLHSLMVNVSWRAGAVPFGLVLAAAALVGLANLVPWLSVGKGAFWRLAYPAVPPQGGLDLVSGSRRIGSTISRAETLKLLTMLVVLGGTWAWMAYGPFERTQMTLFVVGAVSLLSLLGLHWLDHWDFLDHRPIRWIGIGCILSLLLLVLSGYWERLPLFSTALAGSGLLAYVARSVFVLARRRRIGWARWALTACALFWLVEASSRMGGASRVWGAPAHGYLREMDQAHAFTVQPDAWPRGAAPVVLIAVSGGGSRAAVYAAYLLERLHKDLPEVAENIQAMSSVSGGSLVSASYISLRREMRADPQSQRFWPTEEDRLGENCSEADRGLLDGRLVKAVGTDFLYPTLRGALHPLSTRGEAIEASFVEDAHIGTLRLAQLAEEWRKPPPDSPPPFPLPLFNACTLDDHAVVISPLSRDCFMPSGDWAANQIERFQRLRNWYRIQDKATLAWVLDRDEVLAFEDLNPRYDPSLAEAVRASASFPFGFPLVEVETQQWYGRPYTPGAHKVHLTDGGVLSNSGLWTLFQLIGTADSPDGIPSPKRQKMIAELRQRGILLIVIDASQLPAYADNRRSAQALYGAITDQAPIAQNLHRRMFDLLARGYGAKLEIVQLDLPPTLQDSVLTTWALDDLSKGKLRRSFCRVWFPRSPSAEGGTSPRKPDQPLGIKEEIRQRWLRLKELRQTSIDPLPPMRSPALVRPPLD